MDSNEPTDSARISRRDALRKAALGGAIVWSVPILQSIGAPAGAVTPPPGAGCLEMPADGTVTASVISKSALHTLEFGIQAPVSGAVCTNCIGGESTTFGPFPAGTQLVFYMHDHGGVCDSGCDVRFTSDCDDPEAREIKISDTEYVIEWCDAGCGCGRTNGCEGIPAGSNLSTRIVINT